MSKSGRKIATTVILLFAIAGNCPAEYSGGLGTAAEPYEISAVADWQDLMDTPADWDKHFVLTADLDANGVALSPIGNEANKFTGVFDGNDHVIRNADMNMPDADYVGLFGFVSLGGVIAQIGIQDVRIVGDDYVGGLAGRNEARFALGSELGGLFKCYCTGSVSGSSYVGGLVGDNYGEVHACYAAGSVTGNTKVGGLVGGSDEENIRGIEPGIIYECYSTASASGSSYVGGLVGDNYGTIFYCYATGSTTGNAKAGGLVGGNGKETFAGPRGEARGIIHQCYSTGSVSGNEYVGGLVGYHEVGTVEESFWDEDTSGWETSAGGEGKTTTDMQTSGTFISAGWAFVGDTTNGTADIWRMCTDGVDYPRLNWQFSQYADFTCPDGVGLEDFSYLGGLWRIVPEGNESVVNLEGEDGIAFGFGDLMLLCEQWLSGR